MTKNIDPYGSPDAVEKAIKEAATRTHQADPTRQINDLIRQAYYDRFLCRVFASGDNCEWILKGGTGMLARVPNARRTMDADLYRDGFSDKKQALEELRKVARLDLGDHFRFEYREHSDILVDNLQPYADGYRVKFATFLGTKEKDLINVDLSVHVGATDDPTVIEPSNRLNLRKLITHPYRLYPVVNQIADKVCATISSYRNGRPSSREKDLVDLVVIAVTQQVDRISMRTAIERECGKRGIPRPDHFMIPSNWGRKYRTEAKGTPAAQYTISDAHELMERFVDRVLIEQREGTWDPNLMEWSDRYSVEDDAPR
ncbi:MAG: nucleotidyl transferase AbiEii/AbiGii toxin family protein [Propionibacteriaceae bacterium]|jgi:hypothetical protein|nr:nucleotidyl transferase AbiEii/AbiGii toxin family protein [Propionibacteriaceae bacterium]